MNTYEILSLLFLGGSFLIALLAYIDRINKRKKISLPCYLAVEGRLTNFTKANHFGRLLLLCFKYNMEY